MLRKFGLFIILPLIVMLANKGGRNQATTGAPFQNSSPACASCHSGGNYQPVISFFLKDSLGNIVPGYTPGATYNLEMRISSSSGSPKAYGFQAVMVNNANAQSGTFTSLGEKVRKLTLQNRTYLTQLSPLTSGVFTAKWLAPSQAEPATLFIAGLAVNENNNTNGDKGTFTSFAVNPLLVSNTEISTEKAVRVRLENCQLFFSEEADQLLCYDLQGKLMLKGKGSQLDVSSLSPGTYVIQGKNRHGFFAEKVTIFCL
ncbi:MAG: T9SS type A sorting domain-containing protein [Saprospiraceae bacterium]|nr:T9SS type A sorting domain-containing protein [Saprospiraceae bacterium]